MQKLKLPLFLLPFCCAIVFFEAKIGLYQANNPSGMLSVLLYLIIAILTIKTMAKHKIKTNHIVFSCLAIFLCIQRETNLVRQISNFISPTFYQNFKIILHSIYILPIIIILWKNFKTYLKIPNKETIILGITTGLIIAISQIADQINHTQNILLIVLEEGLELCLPFFIFAILKHTTERLQTLNKIRVN